MTQYGQGERANVIDSDVRATVEQRPGFGAENERLPRARAGSPAYPFVDEFRRDGIYFSDAASPDKFCWTCSSAGMHGRWKGKTRDCRFRTGFPATIGACCDQSLSS